MKRSLGRKIIGWILVIQIIVMAVLAIFVIRTITNDKRSTTVNNLETVVQERSQIIENYVESTKDILTAFSRAGEVLTMIQNPEDPDIFAQAQAYTETFSADVDILNKFEK